MMTTPSQDSGLKCICSVYVPVKDPASSAEWWQRNFGLEFAVPFHAEADQAILKLSDGQWLHLVQTKGPLDSQFPNKSGYAMFRLTFEVRQIEALHGRLLENGVNLDELQDRGSCGINFVFYDPDGNKFDVNENVTMHRTEEEVNEVKELLFSAN